VLGLNFPVAMNPALARGLGVMLKLDFQRAILQRIPKMTANPLGPWRDLLFVADEYHAFATVGETDPPVTNVRSPVTSGAPHPHRRHAEHLLAPVGARQR